LDWIFIFLSDDITKVSINKDKVKWPNMALYLSTREYQGSRCADVTLPLGFALAAVHLTLGSHLLSFSHCPIATSLDHQRCTYVEESFRGVLSQVVLAGAP
jgi:hypothetical protein